MPRDGISQFIVDEDLRAAAVRLDAQFYIVLEVDAKIAQVFPRAAGIEVSEEHIHRRYAALRHQGNPDRRALAQDINMCELANRRSLGVVILQRGLEDEMIRVDLSKIVDIREHDRRGFGLHWDIFLPDLIEAQAHLAPGNGFFPGKVYGNRVL